VGNLKPTGLEIGLTSAIFPDLSLKRVLEFLGEHNIKYIEPMCWPKGKADRRYAGVSHIPVGPKFGQKEADEVLALCNAQQVGMSGLGYYPNLLSADRKVALRCKKHLKDVIRVAALLGVNQVNTFTGRDQLKTVDENWEMFLRTWRPLVKFAEDHGVRIGIEDCPMLFSESEEPYGQNLATTPKTWDRMFNDIPSDSFGLCFDPSHLIIQRIDYLRAAEEFIEKMFHFHAKDLRIDDDDLYQCGVLANPGDSTIPTIPGNGDVDWRALLAILKRGGFKGSISVEVEDRTYEGTLQSRKQAVCQAASHLRQFI